MDDFMTISLDDMEHDKLANYKDHQRKKNHLGHHGPSIHDTLVLDQGGHNAKGSG